MSTIPCYSVPPPNEKSKILKKILLWIWIWQVLLCGAKGYYLSKIEFFSELVALGVLWFSFNSLNYCNCVFYIFVCIMNGLFIIINLATKIQDGIVITDFQDQYQKIYIILSSISFVFYIVSIYFAFQAYKEFKGIAYDILVATQNHEQSILSQFNSPLKFKSYGSNMNSANKLDQQESQQQFNIDELKKYKQK
ncbi:transmembrane protein, putative (macronuclear) [Tetrahymena thermophila SB210]|uniref:Transmembrane protein, putative n=1 Tax=Tetrahymena thermophila (strain SB210) TaxID=312017 RepID=W7X4B0_TETTS|nr:transmembrane protein, putative [Tetrahymena thermophila SB210]EWS71243.1 transmembrane protein, putative [Tetrahymena thermophila SB210]|eukprot:XP_012656231.1 transmembrane protein, putative [Tetrahymena thermophila SB210]